MNPDTVTVGLDNLHLTFDPHHLPDDIIPHLFPGLSFSSFESVPPQQKWYGSSHNLKTANGDVLLAFHSGSTSTFGKRNLLEIHGLAFSDSALNALRPLNLTKLVDGAVDLNANVSEFDVYIDDCSGLSPVHRIYEQSLPHNYRDYISSSLIRDHKNKKTKETEQTLPNLVGGTSVYFGRKGKSHCQVLFYQKHLCPKQKVYSPDNQLKYPWIRYELRLKGDAARKHGRAILTSLASLDFSSVGETKPCKGKVITDLFRRYFGFVNPTTSKRASRRTLQSWWSDLLEQASL